MSETKKLEVPYLKQHNSYTCGPVVLDMIFKFFGLNLSEKKIQKELKTNSKKGTDHIHIIKVARKKGFYCYVHENSSIHEIKHFISMGLPVIVNYIEPKYNEGHYAIIIGYTKRKLILNDPFDGSGFKINNKEFIKRWHSQHLPNKFKRWVIVLSKKKFSIGRQYLPVR